ncbi:hypothetical protein HNQ77_002870 [Silvibacterium bohemicum]|uniref:Uncharacterized protein n=1 Tax=Silvibacterium bohemicum TaxID=1577686 RepID=A0A841K3T8_9BACT|nr:hypothetical protein [Silvibacterium bohemicum]MBB6144914.1 hypothetical protein [Silvibacterium bohemicum]
MAQSNTSQQTGDTQLDLSKVATAVTVSAAVAYATGALAINTYLYELGITDFSFAKPKLILTGILVLATFLLLAFSPMFFAWRVAGSRKIGTRTLPTFWKIAPWTLTPIVLLVAASASLCFKDPTGLGQITVWAVSKRMGTRTLPKEFLGTLVVAAGIYSPVCIATLSAFWSKRAFVRMQQDAGRSATGVQIVSFAVAVTCTITSFIAYVYLFTLTFYPAVPQAFGGGQPYFESLVVSKDAGCEFQQLGVPFINAQQTITSPLPVLHESDILFAVWLKGSAGEIENGMKSGLGKGHFVVVQLDKTKINATRAYSFGEDAPTLASPPAACD